MNEQEDQNRTVDEARELAENVSERLQKGSSLGARRAFTQAWRDVVPDLPLRFSVVLVRPDREAIQAIVQQIREGGELPELDLKRMDQVLVHVVVKRRGKRPQRIGDLPTTDARLLEEYGADAELYRPQLLEIKHTAHGRLDYVAIELVRPEVRICSSCGKKHDGPYVNCAKCRASRRRKGEEAFEHAPVAFQDALDEIVSADHEPTPDDLFTED